MRTLGTMCKDDCQNVHVERNAQFSRLAVLLESCPVSNFFFQTFQKRKTNKAVMNYHLTTDVPKTQPTTDTFFGYMEVLSSTE